MHWNEFVDRVRDLGRYPTRAEAESIARIVLSALGGQVSGDEAAALTARLPKPAAEILAGQVPATRALSAAEFVDSVAVRIDGSTPATARWDVSSVLTALAEAAPAELVDRLLETLPPGYALLFGRAELLARAA